MKNTLHEYLSIACNAGKAISRACCVCTYADGGNRVWNFTCSIRLLHTRVNLKRNIVFKIFCAARFKIILLLFLHLQCVFKNQLNAPQIRNFKSSLPSVKSRSFSVKFKQYDK